MRRFVATSDLSEVHDFYTTPARICSERWIIGYSQKYGLADRLRFEQHVEHSSIRISRLFCSNEIVVARHTGRNHKAVLYFDFHVSRDMRAGSSRNDRYTLYYKGANIAFPGESILRQHHSDESYCSFPHDVPRLMSCG